MPRIEGEPGERVNEVWIYLSKDEARDLLDALTYWAEEGHADPQWHHHIGELPQGEVTFAVEH